MAATNSTVVKTKATKGVKVKVKRTRGVGKHKFTEFVPHSKGKPLEAGEKRIILNIVSKLEQERPYELQKEIYRIASKYTGVSLSTVQNIKKEDKHKVIGSATSGKSKSKSDNSSTVKRTRRRKKKQSDSDLMMMMKEGGGGGGGPVGATGGGGASSRQQNNNSTTCSGGDVRNDSSPSSSFVGGASSLPLGLYHHGGPCTQGTYYFSSLQSNIQSQ